MTNQELTKSLKDIEISLDKYVSPNNKDGFYRKFVLWVIRTWEASEFIDEEVVDVGFDVSTHPKKTGLKLKDKVRTYAEFINSNNGNSTATFCSGSGMSCETIEGSLQEVFSDACSIELNKEVERLNISLPSEFKDYADDMSEFIFCQAASHKTHEELYDVCDSIGMRFGSLGSEVEPYVCPYFFAGDGYYANHEHKFANLTLADFKRMALAQC